MYKRILFFALAFLVFQGSMCNKEENVGGTPLMKIDGITIYKEDIDMNFTPGTQVTQAQRDSMLNTMKKLVLLYLAAKDEGFTKDPQIMRKAVWAKRMAIINDFVYKKTAGLTVSDAEVEKFINDRKDLFNKNVSFDILYIYDTTKMPQYIKLFKRNSHSSKLLSYQDMQLVRVESHSDYNLGMGAISFGDNNPITQALVNLPVNGISEPMNMGGFYIVYKKTGEKTQNLDEQGLREYVRQYLLSKKRQEVIDNIYKMYLGKYKPEVVGQ